jgi:hypothetical protein
MATITSAKPQGVTRQRIDGYPFGGVRFDLAVALLTLWFVMGMYQDGWAHGNGFVDNTFFTPWHALLYSGMGAVGLFLAFHQYRNVSRGYAWARALPKGYLASLFGVVLFFVGGGFDFLWHELFGFEANTEALLSPAHMLLATSAGLIILGPIRAALSRRRDEVKPTWGHMLPTLLALLVFTSVLTFFTQYSNFFSFGYGLVNPPGGQIWEYHATGVSYFFYPAVILMGVILFAVRRWRLPFGALTFLFTGNILLMFWQGMNNAAPYWPVIAGLVADTLLVWLRPSAENRMALRVFAFIVPFILFGTALGIMLTQFGMYWRIHMWLGVALVVSFVGLLLSYLVVPPALGEEETAA